MRPRARALYRKAPNLGVVSAYGRLEALMSWHGAGAPMHDWLAAQLLSDVQLRPLFGSLKPIVAG